jgi:hypothetical protein
MTQKFVVFVLVLGLLNGCQNSIENETQLDGNWSAVWETLPESFQNVDNIESFEMTGNFIFSGDSITIIANGFPGCVFGVDTIQHTQGCKISNDTLYLINENNVQGISYIIKSKTQSTLELQLMEDIFIHLKK